MFSSVRTSLDQMTRHERRIFMGLLAARSLTAILDVLGVLLIGVIGTLAAGVLSPQASDAASLFGIDLEWMATGSGLLLLAGLTLGFFLLKAVIAIILTRILTRFVAGVERRTAIALTSRILYSGLSKLQGWRASELTYALTVGLNAAYTRLLSAFASLVTEGFLLLCIAIVLAIVSPVTMVIVVIYFGIIGVVIQYFVGRIQQRAGLALGESTVDSSASITETIGAFREIFTLSRQRYFVERFGRPRGDLAENAGTVQFVMTLPRYIVEAALLLGAVALIASQVLTNNMASAASTLAIFLTAGFRIMASLLPLQAAAGSIRQLSSESKVAYALLEDYPDTGSEPPRGRQQPRDPNETGLGVELSGVTFTYGDATAPALTDVTLHARPGEYAAIIGASGAGKSTLADMLLGLIQPSEGTIELDGMTPREIDRSRPGSIAYVPQRPGLIDGSILENVALGYDVADIDLDRAMRSLAQANLIDHVNGLPDGVRTSVGKQSNALSGGQIQRLGLARALYVNPRLLVLDEATSALDAESESIVGDSLRELGSTVTLIVIAHRLSTVQHADTVHVMEDGRIIASGTFTHLLATVPLVARYAELMSLDDAEAAELTS